MLADVVVHLRCVLGLRSDDVATVRVSYELLELFEMTILPWSSIEAILSGIAVSLTSKWGLVRHYSADRHHDDRQRVRLIHRWVVSAGQTFRAAPGDGSRHRSRWW